MIRLPFFSRKATLLDGAILLSVAAMAALNVAVAAEQIQQRAASAEVRSA